MEVSKKVEGRGVKLLDGNQATPMITVPKPPRPANALLSISECAAFLGLSRWTVAKMLEEGVLPGVILRSGRRKKIWRVREDALEAWIAAKEVETKKLIEGNGSRTLRAV